MIQANELRVGNRFNREIRANHGCGYDPDFVLTEEWMGKLFSSDLIISLDDLFAIPLSEKLLLKVGAVQLGFETFPVFNLFGIRIDFINGAFIQHGSWVRVNGLHHLQNIFYFGNGRELEVPSLID